MTIYGYEYHHIRSGPVPSSPHIPLLCDHPRLFFLFRQSTSLHTKTSLHSERSTTHLKQPWVVVSVHQQEEQTKGTTERRNGWEMSRWFRMGLGGLICCLLRSGINTTWENPQNAKHKSGRRSFRSPDWFGLFDLLIFPGGVYPPTQPHAHSLFLFPIVLVLIFLSMKSSPGTSAFFLRCFFPSPHPLSDRLGKRC